MGVLGEAFEVGGEEPTLTNGVGVRGVSGGGVGVWGESLVDAGTGVRGKSVDGIGVRGESESGDGVFATSQTGAALRATSSSPDHPALVATWDGDPDSPHTGILKRSTIAHGIHGVSDTTGGVIGEGPLEGVRGRAKDVDTQELTNGIGVAGESAGGYGLMGASETESGVYGTTNAPAPFPPTAGVHGFSANAHGVIGRSTNRGGVVGLSVNDRGVSGHSNFGIGVRGSSPEDAPAVLAISGVFVPPDPDISPDGGLALQVIGRSHFSTVGAGVVPDKADSSDAMVDEAVSPGSHVMVMLTGDPGSGISVAWVEVDDGEFVVHLTDKAKADTPFTYFVVN